MASIADSLQSELDSAQIDLADAEIALLEANAAAIDLREKVRRLEAAVAALNGASPPPAADRKQRSGSEGSSGKERDPIEDMTPEEFDAERRRRQREREKERLATDPLAHVKCAGCGQKGVMREAYVQAPSGAPVRVLQCNSCGNQVL